MLSVLCIAVLCALIAPSQQGKPTFSIDKLTTLLVEKGIFENTTENSVLGTLSCTDPDNDPVIYSVLKSSSLSVNPLTGEVTLVRKLDREQSVNSLNPNEKPNSVTFACVDYDPLTGDFLNEWSTVDLVITVRDNNDEYPVFSVDLAGGFTFSVKESDPVNTVLAGTISVTDEDRGANAKFGFLGFDCDASDPEPCQKFKLNYTEVNEGDYRAFIVLKERVDYETRVDYRTRLKAVDGLGATIQLTSSIGIRILVEDSQDTDPIFTNENFQFRVSEGIGVGSQVNFAVSARDGDSGAKRRIKLEILDNPDGINLFRAGDATLVDAARGIYRAPIITRTEIDREISNVHTFTAKATELADNGLPTEATVTAEFSVTILDQNDNSPVFLNTTYIVSVDEMGDVNSTIQIPGLQIEVDDPDEPSNAQYVLEIVSQTFSGAFGFTPEGIVSGDQFFYLTVNNFQYMDYESVQYRRQTVVLKAVEVGPNGQRGTRSSSATVSVFLRDINDNFPLFDSVEYKGAVVENARNFTSILSVSATDADSGSNGELVYSLEPSVTNLFYINPSTGAIYLVNQLDYETQTEYSFLVFASDKAPIPKTGQVLVRIQVTDYNDVGPEFTLPLYTARVLESSTVFQSPVRVTAIDPTDDEAFITYRIVSGNTPTNSFVINRTSGELTLKETVSYEQTIDRKGQFNLEIEASDNGVPPETARSRIIVTVIDENNHDPVFSRDVYSESVSEAIPPGTSVLKVTATDKDFGSNGFITYRIGLGSRDSFAVNRDGVVLISNNPSIDYDSFKQLSFQVIATDGGSPQKTATATVSITVTDANNKAPSFAQPLYNTIVDESRTIGTSVLQVSATDPDSSSTLRYSIRTNTITAINKAGVQVGSTYPYDYRETFSMGPVDGIIRVNSALNRDYVVEMSFEIVVQDVDPTAIGVQTATSRVTITVSGRVNRELYYNLPWTKTNPVYEVPMLESSLIGTEIMTLQARDPADQDSILTLYEEVEGSDPGDYFRIITKTDSRGITPGVVVLNALLDYESGDLIHSVVVRAIKTTNIDSRTVTATVILQVQDFNDNRPEFTQASYRFTVRESAPVNYQVATIRARDEDSFSFGPISFALGGGLDRDDFKLNQPENDNSAQLLVAKPLDFERRRTYSIDIIATDNMFGRGSAIRLNSKAVIEIQVLDENDNTPSFADMSRNFSVPETAPIQTRLGQILAADADYLLNGQIFYSLAEDPASLTSVSALALFDITERSGVLVTRRSLRGLSGGYKLLVVARDGGSPPRSSSIPVTIKVQGAEDDDGTPQWLEPSNNYIVRVEEHKQVKLNVRFNAIARTANASVVYSFAPLSTDYLKFRINSSTGDVFVTSDLDYEVQATYQLVVWATDTKDTTKISARTLIVELIDIDDNLPSFRKSIYASCPVDFEVPTVFLVMDKTPSGRIVAQAQACDADGPDNKNMFYYLYTGNNLCRDNDSGAFKVLLNGSVETKEIMSYEVQVEYLVCVEVLGTARPTRVKRAFNESLMVPTDRVGYLVIRITDVNDNGPSFPADSATAVLETTPSEDTVMQVSANDPDSPQYSSVKYKILDTRYYPPNNGRSYSLRGAFAINPDTGVISTNLPSYQDFARGYFLLQVLAFDNENQSFNDTMTVKVIVYQRSNLLRVVLDKNPATGPQLAENLIRELNAEGQPEKEFFFKAASEHRTGDSIVATQTDICFVLVDNAASKPYEVNEAMDMLDSGNFRNILRKNDYNMIDRGTCYALVASQENVKWRDLWWVLVVIAIFIFICVMILLITVHILYDRYKSYMDTQRTYLVVQ